jgi:hypothetical protein
MLLHWGQRNHRSQDDIEREIFLGKWRDALSTLSEHGRLASLSTEFTKFKGLEVTAPRLYGISASLTEGCADDTTLIKYDGYRNPPETKLSIVQRFDDGRSETHALPDLNGTLVLPLGRGRSTLELRGTRELNAYRYEATPISCEVRGFGTGDEWEFRFDADQREVDGVTRWFVEMNLFSAYVSDRLVVTDVTLEATVVSDWVLRNAEVGDVALPGFASARVLPAQPKMNRNWQFFSSAAASGVTVPSLRLLFRMAC